MWKKLRVVRGMLCTALLLLSLPACAWQDSLSPEDSFKRALAGLSGVDNFAFKGEAAIRTEESGLFQQTLAFEGKLQNHTNLTLSSRTPGRTIQDKTSKGSLQQATGDSVYSTDGMTVSLKRKEGKWNALTSGQAEELWMTRLNPLEQLEYIGESDKKLSAELGAARGTKVLRIELSPEAAANMTKRSLQGQMKLLLERMQRKGDPLYSEDPKVRARLKAVWERDHEELTRMLDQAEAASICHLTIDKRSQLPIRMTMERSVSYVDRSGKARTEALLSDVTFIGY
ncbi:hypothetical protein [Paenibacillus sp. FSL M8-0142]|uniref:hypothetical protein n=1 Tax=Paenibacillus sp. FSL M8-0142 TaxID=2954525 RepID=UPI00315A3F38